MISLKDIADIWRDGDKGTAIREYKRFVKTHSNQEATRSRCAMFFGVSNSTIDELLKLGDKDD